MTGAEAAAMERSAATDAGSKWYVIDTVHAPLADHCRAGSACDLQTGVLCGDVLETADALRREITLGAGAHVYTHKDGIEFLSREP